MIRQQAKEKKHTTKKVLGAMAIIVFALFLMIAAKVLADPSTQLLISVLHFSENTLDDPAYLAYSIDLMDLFQNYMNSDISYEGSAYIKQVKGFENSISGKIKGERSFSQSKLSCESNMSLLWSNLGEINLYAQNKTLYMIVPMLDDMSYAFTTDTNLFKKAPSLTSDISQEWFHEHRSDIIDFMGKIEIDKTGDSYVDEKDGKKCYEYAITVPQGEGKFIYELLGVDMPTHDVNTSIYLDRWYHTHRIVFDLSPTTGRDTTLTVDGSKSSSCIIEDALPFNEHFTMIITRDASINYANSFKSTIEYYANNGKTYILEANISTSYTENGMDGEITDCKLSDGEETLVEAYFNGTITKENTLPDVFRNTDTDFDTIETINWKEIRDDTSTFINQMMDEVKKRSGLM